MPELMHMLDVDHDDFAVCGATLKPIGTGDDDWTEERDEVTCAACAEKVDERAYDQSLPEWIGDEEPEWSIERRRTAAEERAVDRYIEDRLTGGE